MAAIPLQRDDVEYPESDGKPLGETGIHVDETFRLMGSLVAHYRDTPDVYIASNMFLYYVAGDPRKVVCPDLFVVKGVPSLPLRRIFKLWEEGHPPALVIEVSSRSTRKEDLVEKKSIYERIGVEDYLLYDPLEEYLHPPLQGFHRTAGTYQPIQPGPTGALPIRSLGLSAHLRDGHLRLWTAQGEPLLQGLEFQDEARRAAELTKAAEQRARAAEEELARLRAELGRR